MEARLVRELPGDEGWQYEPKWDGFRCIAIRDGARIELQARSGKSLSRYFPEVAAAVAALGARRFVLDGELVIARGETLSFEALQMRLHPAASRIAKLSAATPAALVLFDMPFSSHGASQMDRPLWERRAALERFFAELVAGHAGRFVLTPYTREVEQAGKWLERAGGALDGVVAKRVHRIPAAILRALHCGWTERVKFLRGRYTLPPGNPAHRDGGELRVATRTGLSACIITYNEADRIEECLQSVDFCDEVIVVDSHSTDGTRELAAARHARVIERDWPGYRSQKQFAVEAAHNDWVLCLDADERVSAELRAEIESWRQRGFGDSAGWSVPRITDYFGRFLRHGNAYPDRLIRLFDRRRGGWIGREIHENTRVNGPVGRLKGHLEHYSYRSLTDHLGRMQSYADLMGQALYESGKRCGLAKVLLNPQWRFFRGYVLRLGFLDGWRGLVFALVESSYVRRKYLSLYMRSRGLPS